LSPVPYYQDDAVTIYHGDALEIAPTIRGVDLCLTDPPFFMPAEHYSSRTQWQRSWGDTAILGGWWAQIVEKSIDPTLKGTANVIVFCDDESYPVFYPPLYSRFDRLAALVWDKGRIGMGTPWRRSHELLIHAWRKAAKWTGGGGIADVLRFASVPQTDRVHPVDKPLPLLGALIAPTTDPGDLVCDPFMGGGGTLVAAKGLGRKAIGIEIEERYCEIAARRMGQEVLDLGAAA
jgi:site-specific DNA-methyltransferase (adenine-specific)